MKTKAIVSSAHQCISASERLDRQLQVFALSNRAVGRRNPIAANRHRITVDILEVAVLIEATVCPGEHWAITASADVEPKIRQRHVSSGVVKYRVRESNPDFQLEGLAS